MPAQRRPPARRPLSVVTDDVSSPDASPTEEKPPFFLCEGADGSTANPDPTGAASPAPPPRLAGPALMRRTPYPASLAPASLGCGGGATSRATTPMGSLNDLVLQEAGSSRAGVRDRIACFRWTWFMLTMATGGMANVLYSIPFRAAWLTGVGTAFLLLNIVFFLMNCVLITIRFRLRPGSFVSSFTDQVESLFIPAFFVSLGTILINICQYGIPVTGTWLLHTMEVMFWIYTGLSVVASAGMYLILWSTLVFPIHTMTPTWVFPAYPLLLTAPLATQLIHAASVLSSDSGSSSSASSSGFGSQHPSGLRLDATSVALSAVTTQGTGCLIAFMISAAFIYRLMTQKLPRDAQRPGVFISIGPFSFTVCGLVQLGGQATLIIPPSFDGAAQAVLVVRILSLLLGLWLWGLSLWFFLVSVGSLWKYVRRESKLPFAMTWWSFVVPNTALITATQSIGAALGSRGLQVFGCVMSAGLVVVWCIVFCTMLDCLRKRQLLWPGRD